MKIIELNEKPNTEFNKRLINKYGEFEKLITELNKREIPQEIVISINQEIGKINSFSGSHKDLLKHLRKGLSKILKLIEKDLKLVTKNHYRNMWLAVGMSVFGISFGVAFGVSFGNMAFIGIGIPIGMAMGIAIGTSKDNKAREEGKQLDLEIGD